MCRGSSSGWNPTLSIFGGPCRAKAHPGNAVIGRMGTNYDLQASILALSTYFLMELAMEVATAHDERLQTLPAPCQPCDLKALP